MRENHLWNVIGILATLALVVALAVWVAARKPECPQGYEATLIHSSWSCTIQPVRR